MAASTPSTDSPATASSSSSIARVDLRTEELPDGGAREVTFSDLDFSSSDDEAGVFFGTPKVIERKIVASLSKTIPPSPASRDLALTAASESRCTSLAKRVKKRDSREFLRRKTLLLSQSDVSPVDKVWEGNFYEKDPPETEVDEVALGAERDGETSPNVPDLAPSPVAIDVAANESPSSSDSSIDLDIFNHNDTVESDYDKENTDIPEPHDYTPEPEYIPDEPEDPSAVIALGMREAQLIDLDHSLHLDLGGLNILDVDDPDVGDDFGQVGSTADLLGSSESESGDSSFHSTASTLSEAAVESLVELAPTDDVFEESALSQSGVDSLPSSAESSPAKTPIGALGLNIAEDQLATPLRALDGLQVEDLRVSAAKPLPRELAQLSNVSAADSDLSFASDMDSPMARGPVKIPVFSVPSPRHTPVRGLAQPNQESFAVPEPTDTFDLPSVDSPLPSPKPTPRGKSPVPISAFTPEARQRVYETLPPSQRPSRILKSSHIRTLSKSENKPPPPTEEEVKTKERAKVIRSELDSIFKAKCAGFGLPRPPNGSTSTLNSGTVAATPRRPAVTPVKGLAKPVKAPSPTTKIAKKAPSMVSGLPRPTSSIPTAKRRPESSLSRPTAATVAKAAPLNRPALAVSRRTVVVPSRMAVSGVASGRSVMVPIRPAETPVKMKQQMFEQPASAVARPLAVGVGGPRPTLGPAARLVRDPSSGGLVYATSGGQSFSAEFLHTATPRSPVAPFAPRSPAAHFTPRSPGLSLGRAGRPGVPTATPMRMSRIAGGLGGASRTSVLRQLSPTKSTVTAVPLVEQQAEEASSSGREEPKAADDQPAASPTNDEDKAQLSEEVEAERSPGSSNSDAASGSEPASQADGATASSQEESPGAGTDKRPNGHSEEADPAQSGSGKKDKSTPSPTPAPEPSTPVSASGRPRRTPKPVDRLVQAPVPQKASVTPSIAPGLSEKELKTQTQRNTMRNQVYFCAIDRRIVRVPGPRPPSPTGTIRTIAEKDEEEQKAERDARARRRRASGSDSEDEAPPAIEKVHVDKAPGDEDEEPWKTPLRKRKRVVVSSDDEDDLDSKKAERNVRWDRALTVFRGGLGEAAGRSRRRSTGEEGHDSRDTRRTHSEEPSRSSLKQGSQIQLDKCGNAVDRPVEKLKRQKITVTAVFYDGEEPVPEPAKNTRSKKKKNA